MNIYRFLADIITLLHFCWVIIFILLGFLSLRYKVYQRFYRFFFVLTFGSQIVLWDCPLTALESFFRLQHNPEIEQITSFLLYHLNLEISLTTSIIIFIVAFFVFIIKHEEKLEDKLNVKL